MKSFYISPASITPLRLLKWVAIGFVFWIGFLILSPFSHYLPPDFDYGFLSNKADYFYRSGYFIGFYLHIAGAPIGLFIGGLQMSRTLRMQYPRVHRIAGGVYVIAVLFAAAPGGFIMSMKAFGGWSTTLCFGILAAATWWSTYIGWRAGRGGDFQQHRIWMLRSYVLLLSAVFLRLGHFALRTIGLTPELTYQFAAWISWVIPLIVLEFALGIYSLPAQRRGDRSS
ncbi:DUF2306 domain-containing protein [Stieleria sp. ICT_E10.1]|uniref:DUF2306 domain-containing protein n=1 Tax=Stieleria sedimenti TaxID=2976331 RepID=UPI00217FC677|nr:DUF2306 domain-containing protein [Stieleria sedimenti]MCS7469448.1 DUF2306 domain-containing protein [Stieleria sedimenti]